MSNIKEDNKLDITGLSEIEVVEAINSKLEMIYEYEEKIKFHKDRSEILNKQLNSREEELAWLNVHNELNKSTANNFKYLWEAEHKEGKQLRQTIKEQKRRIKNQQQEVASLKTKKVGIVQKYYIEAIVLLSVFMFSLGLILGVS